MALTLQSKCIMQTACVQGSPPVTLEQFHGKKNTGNDNTTANYRYELKEIWQEGKRRGEKKGREAQRQKEEKNIGLWLHRREEEGKT